MSTYVIGDVQGCYADLIALLEKIRFDPSRDSLWLTGDLVNRGPQSLAVLRYVRQLGKSAVVVLGNHDLHLLACRMVPTIKPRKRDTLDEILRAPDCDELLDWLRSQPLLHHDARLGLTMVHAGLPPQWRLWAALNPVAPVVEWFRYAYLGTGTFDGQMLLTSTAVTAAVLLVGVVLFNRVERTFIDTV